MTMIQLVLCYALLLHLMVSNIVEAGPYSRATIIQGPLSGSLIAGETALFICRAEGNPSPSVNFLLDGRNVNRVKQGIIIQPIPYGAVMEMRVGLDHNGSIVKCIAKNHVGNDTATAKIKVYDSNGIIPSGFPVIIKNPIRKITDVGKPFTFQCRIEAKPAAKVIWFHRKIPILITSNSSRYRIVDGCSLEVKRLTTKDSGEYSVMAYNSVGSRIDIIKELHVRNKQKAAKIEHMVKNIDVQPGHSANLSCQATGEPLPEVWWESTDDIKMSDMVPRGGPVILYLTDITDSRTFVCHARNAYGVVTKPVSVTVKTLPKPPTEVMTKLIGATYAQLSWKRSVSRDVETYSILIKEINNKEKLGSKQIFNITAPGSQTTVTRNVTGLRAYTHYEAFIYAVSKLRSKPSKSATFRTAELPPGTPPQSVFAHANKDNAVMVRWQPPSQPNGRIEGYKVYYSQRINDPMSKWELSKTHRNTLNTYINSLTPNQTYYFKVNAYNAAGDGPVSEPFPIIVRPGVPSQPKNLRGVPVGDGSNKITLIWKAPQLADNMQLTEYILKYKAEGDNFPTRRIIKAQTTEYLIENLSPNTVYEISLAGRTEHGEGIAAQTTIKTKDYVLDPPIGKDIVALGSSEIRISWVGPKNRLNQVDEYLITWAPEPYDSRQHTRIRAERTNTKKFYNYVIRHLKENSFYKVTIAASSDGKPGKKFEFVAVRTKGKAPAAPANLKVIRMNMQSDYVTVELSWRRPKSGDVRGYQVSYEVIGPPSLKNRPPKAFSKNVTSESFKSDASDNIGFGRVYKFTVHAYNSMDISYPASVEVNTPEKKPTGSPRNVQTQVLSSSSIKVFWTMPPMDQQNGVITTYEVKFGEMGKDNSLKFINSSNDAQSIVIKRLKDGVNYRIFVRAYNGKGPGPWSYRSTCQTTEIRPDPPINIRATRINSRQIRVTWDFPKNITMPINKFRIYYTPKDDLVSQDTNKWKFIDVGPHTMAVVENLERNTMYAIHIRSHSVNSRFSDMSAAIVSPKVNFAREDGDSVSDLTCTGVQEGLIIKWMRPKPEDIKKLVEFEITYQGFKTYTDDKNQRKKMKMPEKTKRLNIQDDQSGYMVTIQQLEPNTNFDVNVTPVFQIKNKYFGSTQTTSCRTKIKKPRRIAPPKAVSVNKINSQITVRLHRCNEKLGPIKRYYLVVAPANLANTPPRILDTQKIVEESRHKKSHETPYVVGHYTQGFFGSKPYQDFVLGDINFHQDESGGFTVYTNKALMKSQDYRAFIRACTYPDGDSGSASREGLEDCGNSEWSMIFSTERPVPTRSGPSRAKMDSFTVVIIVVIIGLGCVAVVCIVIGCFMRQRPKQPRDLPVEATLKQPLMGTTPPSYPGPCDPVELRRMNYQTPALVNHPPIPINHLAEQIAQLKANDNLGFSQEYETIDPGQQFTWENSNLDENKAKNRYANVIAYDHSRVVLQPIDNVHGSDYINANYIDGYRKQNAYIATQGPLPETFGDFWRMIWEQRSSIVVMMTKLEERTRVKCDQYWPSRGSETYDGVTVTHVETLDMAYYTIRSFTLQRFSSNHVNGGVKSANGGVNNNPPSMSLHGGTSPCEKREVHHFQFTAWPDHGVPDLAGHILMFIRRIRAVSPPDGGPMVVHCSAGVGRTGAFIVIDTMLERIKHEKTVDIYGHVTCLRSQRNYMVQTEDQYIFIHDVLLDAVMSGHTEVPARNLLAHISKLQQIDPTIQCTGLELEFKKLAQFRMPPSRFVSANLPCNKMKNRLVNILPYESTRVSLQPIRGLEGSDYINASHIDGYKSKRAYIATQGPLPQTTEDFWRMLWEHNSTIIVMLTKLKEASREKCHQYWPSERSARYQYFVVDPMVEYNMPNFILREFKVTDARDGQSRTIRQFQFIDWPEQGVPRSGEAFIDFIGQVHKTKEQFGQEGPITVHCSAGVGRTGVFLSLSVVLERMRYEGVVDLFQTVKMLRTQRPCMVQTEDQYLFSYTAAHEYLSSFDHYAS